MQSYVLIKCEPGSEKETISHLKKLPEVVEVNGIWGKYDIIIKITTFQPHEMDSSIAKIRSIKHIEDTHTMPVLYGQGGTIDD